jgi:BirA family transcriptional regulator, biotin operon repressor / biotin---[acetyl-CoA-carboxylase] ligase
MAYAATPLTFRALHLLTAEDFRSGEQLARSLGVSRTSVWKALKDLEAVGVTLVRQRGRGYRLATAINWLDPIQVGRQLGAYRDVYQLRIVDVVESTNTTLLEQAVTGASAGLMLAAELQTRGRGRRGRVWYAGLGGALTFSVLWRFEQGAGSLAGLGLAVGVALVRALRSLGVEDATLKWPNDLLIRHQKLAGTLVEIQGDVLGPSLAVVGVGINFSLDASTRERVDQAATDLVSAGTSYDRNEVLGRVLWHLAEVLKAFQDHGFGPLRDEWDNYHVYDGRAVTVRLPDGSREEGTVAGVDDHGALLLQTRSGLRRFHSGEVSLRAASSDQRRRGVSSF